MAMLTQSILSGSTFPRQLQWTFVPSTVLTTGATQHLSILRREPDIIIGVATQLRADGKLGAIALAVQDELVVFSSDSGTWPRLGPDDPLRETLAGPTTCLAGYYMGRMSVIIANILRVRVSCAIDPLWLKFDPDTYKGVTPGSSVTTSIDPAADSFAINALWDDILQDKGSYEKLCLRAWIAGRVANSTRSDFNGFSRMDTMWLRKEQIRLIARMLIEVECIDASKPNIVHNEFEAVKHRGDDLTIHNSRYKNKVRTSETTKIVMTDAQGREHVGRATKAHGKQTTVKFLKGVRRDQIITAIRVVGRENVTSAEKARDYNIELILQGKRMLRNSAFIDHIYFPKPSASKKASNMKVTCASVTGRLNQSQANVVEAMTATDAKVIVVHGPPGTGKTSTISAAVEILVGQRQDVWIVAQSNVGVKNIAESLCKQKVDFKLLVSKEFYVEWHEHIYNEVCDYLIRTDELPLKGHDVDILFENTRVILCTLSMLSNPVLKEKGVFERVPVRHLVVDEASQIGIINYFHLFTQLTELKKMSFFGDPKQLPPYGQESARSLQCVFDLKHLKSQAFFLNTQYRMPTPLGNFISSAVYDDKLNSHHRVHDNACVALVDVNHGSEVLSGKSWMNMGEVHTVLHLVRHYYARKDFCIITPYDAQRKAIQDALRGEKLPWENVFNVDSYQGNEAEFVLVSVVRTSAPGFLRSQERVNVMLTRCKAGMVIVTNRAFACHSTVHKTLLGGLCKHWEKLRGKSAAWSHWRAVLNQAADLPGTPGKNTLSSAPFIETVPAGPPRLAQSVNRATSGSSPVLRSLATAPKAPHIPSPVLMRQPRSPISGFKVNLWPSISPCPATAASRKGVRTKLIRQPSDSAAAAVATQLQSPAKAKGQKIPRGKGKVKVASGSGVTK